MRCTSSASRASMWAPSGSRLILSPSLLVRRVVAVGAGRMSPAPTGSYAVDSNGSRRTGAPDLVTGRPAPADALVVRCSASYGLQMGSLGLRAAASRRSATQRTRHPGTAIIGRENVMPYEVKLEELTAQPIAAVRYQVAPADISAVMGEAFQRVFAHVG